MSGKQEGLSNTDTKHSTDIASNPEKSKKGEGTPETAKLKGTVRPSRPQVQPSLHCVTDDSVNFDRLRIDRARRKLLRTLDDHLRPHLHCDSKSGIETRSLCTVVIVNVELEQYICVASRNAS